VLKTRGALYTRTGDYIHAEMDFTRAIQQKPLLHWLYEERSIPRFYLGRFAESLQDISTSCQLLPGNGIPLVRIPCQDIATCPDEGFRDGLLALAVEVMKDCRGATHWSAYAELLTACARYDEAEIAYARAIELGLRNRLHLHLYRFALLQFWREKDEGARRTCQHLLNQFADTESPEAASFAAWTSTLVPDAVDDYSIALTLATRATEAEPGSDQFQDTLGAVLFRAGRHAEALEQLTALTDRLDRPDRDAGISPGYAWYFLAMTHHALGNADAAGEWLEKANDWTDQVLTDEENPPLWNRKLTLELLRDEANSLIGSNNQADGTEQNANGQLPPPPPATQRESEAQDK